MRYAAQPRNIDKDRQALAPYNFVPLPDQVVCLQYKDLPNHGEFDIDRLSGWIDCELTTESPLYVRTGLSPERLQAGEEAKDQPEFFHRGDVCSPVIPGSTLRGMLRAIVEIASFSKIAPVSDTRLVYRAVGDTTTHGRNYRDRLMLDNGNKRYTPTIRGGYMRKQGADWTIQPACEVNGTTYAYAAISGDLQGKLRPVTGCRNSYEIFVRVGNYEYRPVKGGFLQVKYARVERASACPEPGFRRGILAMSGWISSKRTEAVIYEPDDSAVHLKVSDDLVDAYKDQMTPEQEQLLGDDGVLHDGHPVFYVLDEKGGICFFGHCRMFRLPYPFSVRDYIPSRLREEPSPGIAEAIFGYTNKSGEGKARTYAGRVFVTDATLEPGQTDLWLTPARSIIPKILASPKPTTFQHYLVQTRPNKFEIGKTRDNKPKYELRLSDYASPITSETVIRGHKLYWHKGEVDLAEISEQQPIKMGDKQHTRIQPLRTGVRFQFRIDFSNLSRVELGAILWVLDVAADPNRRLKLGMGKPLGMGSIRITSTLHLINRKARYRCLFDGDRWAEGTMDGLDAWRDSVTEFERFIIDYLGEKAARRLQDLERIQALLALLSWPGPDPATTRYMEIERQDERGRHNEYRERPVLSHPLDILSFADPASRQSASGDYRVSNSTPASGGLLRGTVKRFGLGSAGSYGFIKPDDGGNDIFVHKSRLEKGLRSLEPGARVTFRIGQGMRGAEAIDVQLE